MRVNMVTNHYKNYTKSEESEIFIFSQFINFNVDMKK